MATDWNVHWVPGGPGVASQPSLSPMKAISRLEPTGSNATKCSCQVSARSVERKSRAPATSAHTTLADGALSCAKLGSAIGVAETVGEGAADAVEAGAVLGDGGAVEALDAGGGVAQALSSARSAAGMTARFILNTYSACAGNQRQRVSASTQKAYTPASS